MKYKGIELVPNTEAELLIGVEVIKNFNNECELEDYVEELENKIMNIPYIFLTNSYTETAGDDLIYIKFDDIAFNETGINILKEIYDGLVLNLKKEDIRIFITIRVDGDERFKREDGSKYNEDEANTWDEFMENLEM